MKKRVGTAFSLVGAVIGAGMMTGAEIKQYFGSGSLAFFNILFSVILIACVFSIVIRFCNSHGVNNIKELNELLFGRYSVIFNCLVYFGSVVCSGAMLAGTGELMRNMFGINAFVFSLALAIAGSLLAYKGVKWINAANIIAIPAIACFVIVLFVVSDVKAIENTPKTMLEGSVFSIYNASLAMPLCCSIKISSKKLGSSLLIFAVVSSVIIAIISVLISGCNVNAVLPLFDYVLSTSVLATVFYSVSLIAASVSTYISSMVAFSNNLLSMFFATICAIMVSTLELKSIVKYIYPISGILCIIYLLMIFIKRIRK